ncbi:flagellin N-terminal helical domain-containing protein [Algisphaera agarilytica]|uniref:Flagellin n=1 Tax=Algisphaera agarilytica TaxID=1385975 RepID=A0A7X0LL37_9BACT|nr:flagellin [Algisphaera agarilytica]MBB6430484.1 flagellin [Algisphaera agarilytica]
MSRINTNVTSLLGQRVLGEQNRSLNTSLERLSTGLRINRGGDDPAGLIASEALRSQKSSITAAIGNAERAEQVVNVAEGGLQEVNNLLLEVQSLVGQSANDAGLSLEEKEANQLQIDSILQTIDRISETTSFQGTKLLNGTYDFNVESQAATVNDIQINAAKLAKGDTRDVKVLVTQSAQNAGFFLSTAGALDLSAADAAFTFDLAGAGGSRQFSFASGTSVADIASTINTFTDITGVSATASGTGVKINSTGLGSSEFVSVDIKDDAGQAGGVYVLSADSSLAASTAGATAYSAASNPLRDEGQDLGATINGVAATTNGGTAKLSTDFLDVEIDLTTAGAQALGSITAATITGGGANFNLGANVDIGNQVSIGIGSVATRNLGTETNGFLSSLASGQDNNVVDGSLTDAQKVVNDAISEVSTLRGRLGAFQKNTVGSTIRSLGVALENTSAAESAIRDTDFAAETAELTRSQILVQAATNALGIANSQPQNALSLLR